MQLADKVVHADEGRKGLQDVGAEVFLRSGRVLDVIGGRVQHLSLILFPGRPREEVRMVRLVLGDVLGALGIVLGNLFWHSDVPREGDTTVQLDKSLVC